MAAALALATSGLRVALIGPAYDPDRAARIDAPPLCSRAAWKCCEISGSGSLCRTCCRARGRAHCRRSGKPVAGAGGTVQGRGAGARRASVRMSPNFALNSALWSTWVLFPCVASRPRPWSASPPGKRSGHRADRGRHRAGQARGSRGRPRLHHPPCSQNLNAHMGLRPDGDRHHLHPHTPACWDHHGAAPALRAADDGAAPGNASSLVWVETPAQAARLVSLPDAVFASGAGSPPQGPARRDQRCRATRNLPPPRPCRRAHGHQPRRPRR